MSMMTLADALALLHDGAAACGLQGALRVQAGSGPAASPGSLAVQRVHTDTRSLQPGDLFVALRGERFDAHDLLAQARERGAVAAIAERGLAEAGLPGIEVSDSRRALAALAAGWRRRWHGPLVAVTGSNGKTTVTQMVAAILRQWQGEAAHATEGNLNNDIGVPMTVLRLRPGQHRASVVELGMNHPGEIALLAAIAQPTVALVNNAQREHLEFMSTVEAVARENGGVLQALPADGVAVFPADDAYSALWRSLAGMRRVLTFGAGGSADLSARAEWADGAWQVHASTPAGAIGFRLAIAGRHNVRNALAAAACALAAGVPPAVVAQGLEAFRAVKGRSRSLPLPRDGRVLTLIDDTYNANPDSMRAAVDVLSELPGPHLLVLGDMGEVGDQGPEFHAEIGEYAAERGIETLLCTGELMRYGAAVFPQARHFGSVERLIEALPGALAGHRSVLVKGSRFMRMERVVEHLLSGEPHAA